MTWEYLPAHRNAARLPAPDDGIVAALRPRTWLAQTWLGMLDKLKQQHQPRLTRGRSLARSGRVRDLWFAPGLAAAEVVDAEALRVSLRVRVLEDAEWRRVERVLLRNLGHIAALLEGELPQELVDAVASEDVSLVPSHKELDGDCGCGDFLLPCPHMAAIHQLLADVLDEDPFVLLTLRGRTHEQLLARLRAAWGDAVDDTDPNEVRDEPVPESGDFFAAPTPAGDLRFTLRIGPTAQGLRMVGPPPGGVDLVPALEPLYAAGADAALRAALHEEPSTRAVPDEGWTEQLVDLIALHDGVPCTELAARLGADLDDIGRELLELETLGLVYRSGDGAQTRWWLG